MAPKFNVGDRISNGGRHGPGHPGRVARVLYAGKRLYVLEAEKTDGMPAWEYSETHRYIDIEARYELVPPPKWEVGGVYRKNSNSSWEFRVTAVDGSGNALGILTTVGRSGPWSVDARTADARALWEEVEK
jgi:hypothetical protein